MTLENLKLQSAQFWMSGFTLALVDAAFIVLLIWRVKSSNFRELKWMLVGTAVLFWSIFAIVSVLVFWNSYYHYFFPGWFRSGGTLPYVPILYGVFALAFHWLSLRAPGNPILHFCLLGGLESLLEHLFGIYGLKILEVPLLQETSPMSILAFAFPEYIFYWCIVISIAVIFQKSWRWWINMRHSGARVA